MNKGDSLGQFEQLVLTAAHQLRGGGYSVNIHDRVMELQNKKAMIGAVFVSLDRLEARGFLTSWFETAPAEQGGKKRRYFKVTPEGEQVLSQTMATAKRMIDALGDLA